MSDGFNTPKPGINHNNKDTVTVNKNRTEAAPLMSEIYRQDSSFALGVPSQETVTTEPMTDISDKDISDKDILAIGIDSDNTVGTGDFPVTVPSAIESFTQSAGPTFSAEQVVDKASKWQRDHIGVFSPQEDGENFTQVKHLQASVSGIVRMPKEEQAANLYWSVSQHGGHFRVHTGAAQGVNEKKNEAGKYKKDEKSDYVEDQVLTHMAAALLGHMVQHDLNQGKNVGLVPGSGEKLSLEGYQPPSVLMLSNYMTDFWLKYEDGAQVGIRKAYMQNLLAQMKAAQGLQGAERVDAEKFVHEFQQKLYERLLKMGEEQELIDKSQQVIYEHAAESVKAVTQPGKLIFNRQGLNAFRVIASWDDSSPLLAQARLKIAELKKDLEKEGLSDQDKEFINKDMTKIQSVMSKLAGAERRYRLTQFLSVVTVLPALLSMAMNRSGNNYTNFPLHKEGLKINLLNLIGGVDVGGCQSAKDRYGSLMCVTRAQEDYIDHYGQAPAAFGLLSLIPRALNLIPAAVNLALRVVGVKTNFSFFPNYTAERHQFYKQKVAEHWVSGAMQYVAQSNSPGALGIKNNSQIIPSAFREEINSHIEEKILKNLIKLSQEISGAENPADALSESVYLKQIQYLTMCFPAVSEKLAGINEGVKKDPEEAQRKLQSIQKKCSKYLKPILKDIAKQAQKSATNDSEKALISQLHGHIMAPYNTPIVFEFPKNDTLNENEVRAIESVLPVSTKSTKVSVQRPETNFPRLYTEKSAEQNLENSQNDTKSKEKGPSAGN